MSEQAYALDFDLPPDAVPQHGVGVVAFFDAEGNTRYALTLEGAASLSAILGLLEVVKARVLAEADGW
jgi:hypothetical protein